MSIPADGGTPPASGTPPAGGAGAPAGAPPAGGNPPAGGSADWTSGLNEDLKGYVTTKGFKDVSAVLDSYRNSESLIGKLTGADKDRMLALPAKDDDAEGWSKVHTRLGRPEKADGYSFKGENAEFVKTFKEVFHGAGLSDKQATAVVAKWNDFQNGRVAADKAAFETKAAAELDGLKKEWGGAYEQNEAVVDRAAAAFGMNEQQLLGLRSAMGVAGAMKFLHAVGSKMGEGEFVSGGGGQGFGGALTPAQAKGRVNDLMNDSGFTAKYFAGDVEAKAEMDRLHAFMAGGA